MPGPVPASLHYFTASLPNIEQEGIPQLHFIDRNTEAQSSASL